VTTSQFIQLLGEAIALFVVLERIANLVRDWRGGSPELRIIKAQLVDSNARIYSLLERIVARLDER